MRLLKLGIAAVVAVVVLVSAGTYAYIHFIEGDPPPKLTLQADSSSTVPATDGATIAGAWTAAASGSTVGYRVKEVLFGQSATAYGRTSDVTGSMTVSGTTVSTAKVVADMTTVSSDRSQRDGQFRGRIMETDRFPTATFELTKPLDLGRQPAAGEIVKATAAGKLTLHGTTRDVSVDLSATWNGGNRIEVNGEIPVTFADYGIPNPSFGGVSTEDHGLLELLVVFTKS